MLLQPRWVTHAPADGSMPETVTMGGFCLPTVEQIQFANKLGYRLNRESAHGGRWVVCWTDVDEFGCPERLAIRWIDEDDDSPILVDCEESRRVIIASGPEHFAQQCEQAYQEYLTHLKEVEVSKKQMKKIARGEAVADPRVRAPIT